MSWWIIYKNSNGMQVSESSTDPDIKHNADLVKVDVGSRPLGDQMWDEKTRAHKTRPAKVFIDRIDDLFAKPKMVAILNGLTSDKRKDLRQAFILILGESRFRGENEPESIA